MIVTPTSPSIPHSSSPSSSSLNPVLPRFQAATRHVGTTPSCDTVATTSLSWALTRDDQIAVTNQITEVRFTTTRHV
jgi:hypothetical protein